MGDLTWSHGEPLASGRSSGTRPVARSSDRCPTGGSRPSPAMKGQPTRHSGDSASAIPPLTSGRLRTPRPTIPSPRPPSTATEACSASGVNRLRASKASPPLATGIAYLRRVATCPLTPGRRYRTGSSPSSGPHAGTVSYFSTLESIETTLFQEQGATFPAIDAAFKLPPNPPDRSATYLKLIKSGLEIAGDILQLLPGVNLPARLIRTVALTAHAFGAVGEGLGLANSPSAPESYAQITDQLAKIQQRERDISEAQRRYVLGDYGLLMTVGTLTNGRLLTLDSTAMRSIGRQTFAQWVYELYLPAYARRYDVTNCRYDIKGVYCDIPNGSLVRAAPGGKFTGVFWMNSDCTRHLGNTEKRCTWHQVPPGIAQQLVSPISKDCQYDGAPGSTAVWRYGCGLGKWLVCHPEMKKSPPKGRRFHLGRRGVRWNGARRTEI